MNSLQWRTHARSMSIGPGPSMAGGIRVTVEWPWNSQVHVSRYAVVSDIDARMEVSVQTYKYKRASLMGMHGNLTYSPTCHCRGHVPLFYSKKVFYFIFV